MTVLVTGGGGFVGLATAEALQARGHEVVLADRDFPMDLVSRLQPLATVRLDVTDRLAIEASLKAHAVDRVIHAAAVTAVAGNGGSGLSTLFDVNVVGTITVCEAARACRVRRVVLVSSGAVHEGSGGTCRLTEHTFPMPVSPYGVSKHAAEIAARACLAAGDVDLKIVRLGPIFGPFERVTMSRSRTSVVQQLLERVAAGLPTRYAEGCPGDWLYSRDAGFALSELATGDALPHDLYLLSAGEPRPLADAVRALSAHFPASRVSRVPEGGGADLISDFARAPFCCARAKADFAFRSRSFAAAVSDYLGWTAGASDAAAPA